MVDNQVDIPESMHLTAPHIPPNIGAFLASLTEQTPSNDGSAVMRAALGRRAAVPAQPPPSSDEVVAFARSVDDVLHTLSLLTAGDYGRSAVNGLTIGELVGHLIGTQLAMAAELGLSLVTVKVHRGQVMRKMLAKSVPDLVRMADGLNLPHPTS